MSFDAEVLIVGGGPAGLTAALTLARLTHTVIVFDNDDARNKKTPAMTMLIAHDGQKPTNFRDESIKNLTSRHQNVKIENTTIEKVRKIDNGDNPATFEVQSSEGKTWTGQKLVLATGCDDVYPDIEGYENHWGHGIYHCYFYKGYTDDKAPSSGILAVDIMEDVMKSMHAARYATQLSSKVTIYTNDNKQLADGFAASFGTATDLFTVDNRKIARFFKPEASPDKSPTAVGIEFADGSKIEESFIGHYPLSKAKGPFHEQLGLPLLPSGDIVTHAPWLQTDVRGVFACGDNSQPRKIIPEAQNTGSLVGAAVSNQIIAERFGQAGLV